MGRSESKQAYQDSSAMAKQNQAAAAAASAKEDQAIGDYRNSIGDFQRFTENEFRPGGQYTQDQDVLATSANAGGQNSTEDYYRNAANRMNLTAPQMTSAAEEGSRQGRRDVSQILRNADLQRMAALGHGEESVMSALSAIPAFYGQQYGVAPGGAANQMGNATGAARTPGFWDTFLPAVAAGAGQAAGGYLQGQCWIAEAIYGVTDPRTHLVREWLGREFARTPLGGRVMKLYERFGRQVARRVARSRVLQAFFRPLFDRALSNSIAWKVRQSAGLGYF